MDIIDALEQDHHAIRTLFQGMLKNDELDQQDRELLFPSLRAKILAHAEAEERDLYGPLDERGLMRDEVMEGREEHRLTAEMMISMDKPDLTDEEWMAKLKVLKDVLGHHLDEEEEGLFVEARRAFGKREAQELGKDYERTRDAIEAHLPRA